MVSRWHLDSRRWLTTSASSSDKFKKLARRWVGEIGAGAVADGVVTTIPLASATNLPTDTGVVVVIDRVDANGTATPQYEETVYGVVSGSNLATCTRGVEGTAQAHNAGAVVEVLFDAAAWGDVVDGILVQHTQSGTHNAITAVSIGSSSATVPLDLATGTYQPFQSYTPAGGATATLNLALGNHHRITMPAGNATIALTHDTVGQKFIVDITQDSVGSRTVTWFSTIRWVGGSAPTLTTTASKRDSLGFIVTGSGTYDGFVIGQNI